MYVPDALTTLMQPEGGAPVTPLSEPLDYGDPLHNLLAFGRLWSSFDEPAYGCFHGTMFASIGTERLRPLFGYAGIGVFECRFIEGDRLQMRGKETGFFTDLASGAVLESWENPFTEETVDVFDFLNDNVRGSLGTTMPRFHFGSDDDEPSSMNAAVDDGADAPFVMPWQVYPSQVLLSWDYTHEYDNPVDPGRYPKASTGPRVNPSEHFSFFVDRNELEDPSTRSAHFQAGFTRLSPWWPWMRMGGSGIDGVLFGRMHSYKLRSGLDDIPRPLLEHVDRFHPAYLEPAADWGDGQPIGTWEAYARDEPPETDRSA